MAEATPHGPAPHILLPKMHQDRCVLALADLHVKRSVRKRAKRFRVSTAAMGLWAMAGSWSREEKTSGFVPRGALRAIAPDLTDEDIADIAAVAVEQKLDGLICSNTTIARPMSLKSALKTETGGLSGKPLFKPSTDILRAFSKATNGAVPLIGVGGILSGADAYEKIRAGASLVQIYSGLVYEGPSLAGRACRALAGLLKRDGFRTVSEAVGADNR